MATSLEELKLNISWDIIDACSGLSLDIGGSVNKIVYLHKDDWVEPQKRNQNSSGCLRFVKFSKEQLQQAFEHVQPRVHIMRKSPADVVEIYTTGIGGAQFDKDIKERFNVKSNILTEFDCFVHGFRHIMKTTPRKDILHELHKEVFQALRKECAMYKDLVEKSKSMTQSEFGDLKEYDSTFPQETEELTNEKLVKEKNMFPCMLMMLGSGFGFIIVNEDGTFMTVDGSNRGGRTFLGLGSMLTGAKTYDDILQLCEKGNGMKVTSTNVSLMADMGEKDDQDEEDVYDMWMGNMEELPAYSFGQAVGKSTDDFKKEDLAKCLLETMALDLAHCGQNTAEKYNISHTFFCGSFISHPLVREVILREWIRRELNASLMNAGKGHQCQAHFLKHGPWLGAFGAFLNSKLQFSNQNKDTEEKGQAA